MTNEDKITLIVQLVQSGTSIKDICAQVGVGRSTLYRLAHDHGLRLSKKRLVDEPERIQALLSSGLTQMEIGRRLNIGRGAVRYWAKRYGGMRHVKKCALFECGREFKSQNPNATCCCYGHLNRHLARHGAHVEWRKCGLPECNKTFISVGGHRLWCCKDHHELHRRRLDKSGLYARIVGATKDKCIACEESVVLDSHHVNHHRNKSLPGEEVWLCPTHHMSIHRGLARIVDGKYLSLISSIDEGLRSKWPSLVDDITAGKHKRTAVSGKSFMKLGNPKTSSHVSS